LSPFLFVLSDSEKFFSFVPNIREPNLGFIQICRMGGKQLHTVVVVVVFVVFELGNCRG
jgi:hypothetical protein